MLQPAIRSTSRLSSTNGSSSASASRRPSVDLPAPRRPDQRDAPAARRIGAVGAEQLRDRDARAAQVGVALAAQRLAQHQPLGRAGRDVADQLGEVAVERAGDLLQDQDRCVADAVFEVGQVPLGHARGLGDRLAGEATTRPQEPDALAEGEQKGVLGRGRHSCTIVLDDPGRNPYRAGPATFSAAANLPMTEAPENLNFAEHLFATNRGRAGKVAYVDDRGVLAYGELEDRSRRFAAALLGLGVRREERVLLLMLDCNEWPVAFLGALYAGVVPVAVNTLLTGADYAYMLAHSRAQAAIVSASLEPTLRKAMAEAANEVRHVIVAGAAIASGADSIDFDSLVERAKPLAAPASTRGDDPAFWLYSSGSTGRPKGTVHTHANAWWTAELYGKAVLALSERDVCFSAAKLYFAYGLGNALTFPLSVGASVVLMAERPTPDAVFKRWTGSASAAAGAGPDLRPTVFFGAPPASPACSRRPALPAKDAVALRMCSSAGEALPGEIGQRFERHFGCAIVDGIGSTEMLHVFLSNRPGDIRYGTTGKPVPGYEIELRGEDGRPVADGEVGDLFIKGPSAALMYWGNREKSRETFQGGWTKSGDKYVRDADGYYTYSGRSDDMLKVSGIWVSPFEVEATLMQHPAVLECAVIGTEDGEGLTKTKAFVVVKPGAAVSDADLKAFVKEKLAAYKYPRAIEFLAELPKTATGKIQRFRLRERERAGAATP
jgi:benzoate-CoA ligase